MQERQIISEQPKISEDEKKKLLAESETSFHFRRRIQIKGLPSNVSEEQVAKVLLSNFNYNNIYKDAQDTVHILFSTPEQAQQANNQFNGKSFNNQLMTATYSQSTFLLYVGNMTYDCSLENFREFASQYGAIERIFLVYDKKSGHSKGYGFVEYVNQSDAESARIKLQQDLKEKKIKVEYAPSGMDTYDKVHSTALCVENFPANTSVEEIRELLSSEANILFCQIVGESALVDVATADEAERAWIELDGSVIGGSLISIRFLSPLRSAKSMLSKSNEVVGLHSDSNNESQIGSETAVNPLPNKSFQKQPMEKNFNHKQPFESFRSKFDPRANTGVPNRYPNNQSGQGNQNQHIRMGNQNHQMRQGNPNQQVRPGNPNQYVRPNNPNQHSRLGNPNQPRLGNPNQPIRSGNANQQARPGNPNQQVRPGNMNQHMRPGNPNQQVRSGNPNQQTRPGNPNQNMWSENTQIHRNQSSNFRNPNSQSIGNQKQRPGFSPGFQTNSDQNQRFPNPRFTGSPISMPQQGPYLPEKFHSPQTQGGFNQNGPVPNNLAQHLNQQSFNQGDSIPSNKEPLGVRQQNPKVVQNQEYRPMLPQKQEFQPSKQQYNQSEKPLNQPSNPKSNTWNSGTNIQTGAKTGQNFNQQFNNPHSTPTNSAPNNSYGSYAPLNNKANSTFNNNPYHAPTSSMPHTGYGFNTPAQNQNPNAQANLQTSSSNSSWNNQSFSSQNNHSANNTYDSTQQWSSQTQPNFLNTFQPDSIGQQQKQPPWISNMHDSSAASKLSRKSRWGPENLQNSHNPPSMLSNKPVIENKQNYDPIHAGQAYQHPSGQMNNQPNNWSQMQGYPMQNSWTNPVNNWNQSHSQSQRGDNNQVPTYNQKQQPSSSQYPPNNQYNPFAMGTAPPMQNQSSVSISQASQPPPSQPPPSQPNMSYGQQNYSQPQATNKSQNTAQNMTGNKYPTQIPGSNSMNVYSNPSAPQTGYNQTPSVSTLASGYNVPAASGTFNGAPSIPSFSGMQGPVIPSAVPVAPNPVPNPAAQQYIQYYQQWYASQMATNTPEYASLMGQVSSFANQYFSQSYVQPATSQSQTVVTQAVSNSTMGSAVATSVPNTATFGSIQSSAMSQSSTNPSIVNPSQTTSVSYSQAQSVIPQMQQPPVQGFSMPNQWQQQMQQTPYQSNQLQSTPMPTGKNMYTPAAQQSQAVSQPPQASQNSAAAVYYQENQGYSQQTKRPRY